MFFFFLPEDLDPQLLISDPDLLDQMIQDLILNTLCDHVTCHLAHHLISSSVSSVPLIESEYRAGVREQQQPV